MRKHLFSVAAVLVVGCASASSNMASSFGPSVPLRPSIQTVTEGRGGSFTVRLNLPQQAYVAAVEVYPNRTAVPLGMADVLSGTRMLHSGSQTVAFQTLPTTIGYSAPDWTLTDLTRCNTNARYPGCQQQGYLVIVASDTPFSPSGITDNLATVDLRGSNDVVISRIGNAVAHATGAAWGAASGNMSAMLSPF